MMRRSLLAGIAALLVCVTASLSGGPQAASPLLVVRHLGGGAPAEVTFTEEQLRAMPQVTIRTRTEFTDGLVEFRGPLARDVLAAANLGDAKTAHLVASNDYALDVPVSDFTNYDVILAMEANGTKLSRRDKGPIWLMYPLDDHPELQDPAYTIRLVWQLVTVELH